MSLTLTNLSVYAFPINIPVIFLSSSAFMRTRGTEPALVLSSISLLPSKLKNPAIPWVTCPEPISIEYVDPLDC